MAAREGARLEGVHGNKGRSEWDLVTKVTGGVRERRTAWDLVTTGTGKEVCCELVTMGMG